MSYKKDLYLFHDDNSSFIDYTSSSRSFLRDDFEIIYNATEDSLYLGLYKPFYSTYVELVSAVGVGVSLTVSYYNGSSFVAFDANDETNGFARNGFITWDRDLDDWAKTEVNGETLYWVKIDASGDYTATFRAINLVFANDDDLKSEMFNIDDFRATGMTSLISYHVSARDEMIQKFRNSGKYTQVNGTQKYNDLSKWDLNNIDQVRVAAKYLALAKIMFDVSSEVDDKYYQRYKDYMDEFGEAFRLYLLSIDSNDDGIEDVNEKNLFRSSELIKV